LGCVGDTRTHHEKARSRFCRRGHEYTPENTLQYLSQGRWPTRGCRACKVQTFRAWSMRPETKKRYNELERQRSYKRGALPRPKNLTERLERLSMPEPNTGCHLWIGPLTRDGYGLITIGSKPTIAHRASYTLSKGPIPSGLRIDHLCRVRCCINPAHLEAVTSDENIRRGLAARFEHWRNGRLLRHPPTVGSEE
jgi:hypothetical protein